MCGITGFFKTSSPLQDPEQVIMKMTDCLIHRGPDEGQIWFNENIALGHRRLAIQDKTVAGSQPMRSHHGRYVIVYNGEIYNARQLKTQLKDNYPFQGHSDTEVILALIEIYGLNETLKQLTGMFALALWDNQEKILQLARDRVGEKPLYYGIINQTFVFSSELKALRIFPNFKPEIEPASVSAFMQYGYIKAPQAIYKGIYKLLPGTLLTLSDASILTTPKPYWSAFEIASQGIRSPRELTDEAAIQQLDNKLHHIIRHQMIADVPTGAFLSGGIDSSVVAAIMQANSHQAIKTFTIGFKEKKYNEAHHAKAIAKHLKTDHTELYVAMEDVLSVIPKLPSIYDEPFADSSAIPTYILSKLTSEQVTVALSGDGGDELFGGYNRYLWGPAIWNKMRLFPYTLRLFVQKILISTLSTHNKSQKIASILTARSPSQVYQQLISQWSHPNDIVYTQRPEYQLLYELESSTFIEKMMVTDLTSYLPDDIMVKVDRAGMAVSLENRAPFLDHHLIEWMWSLPLQMKIRQGQTKWLLRQVLSQYVPPSLFERPKMGFGIPLDSWLRGPLKAWANDLLNKDSLDQHGFLISAPIIKKWQEHLSGRHNWQYQLWPVLMFQAWLQYT